MALIQYSTVQYSTVQYSTVQYSTVQYSTHLHTNRTTQNKPCIEQRKNVEECGPCPIFASFTLAFALQLRKKHGKIIEWIGL